MEIAIRLKKKIDAFELVSKALVRTVGSVIGVGDGVATIQGLDEALMGEQLDFGEGIFGVVFNLEENKIGAIIYGDFTKIIQGQEVSLTGKVLEVPVGEELLGRAVDALGQPIDGKGPIKAGKMRVVERIAPGVMERKPVDTAVQTGIIAIDSMIPIGRGQRELIIGDRSTGKTAIAIDTIINQKGKDLICIYVAIGQKRANIAKIVDKLEKTGSMGYTIIVAAPASDPVSMQYLAPYAGCAMGEEFLDSGKDALIVYDDLTKHAWAYRQISLILRRPPGREAYPGDIFYLHSRLLERACKLDDKYGGGSLTALPVVETQAGDVSAYIPTNIISITDGQIYLETDLFNAGIRPAINAGLSVSRVGGAAQIKAMKQVAGKLRLDIAQFRELAAFAQFGSDLDQNTLSRLERGKRITEILKQPQYEPLPVITQVALLLAATEGYIDDMPLETVPEFIPKFRRHWEEAQSELIGEIEKEGKLTDKTRAETQKVLKDFKLGFK